MVIESTPRKTPEEDVERLAENLWNNYGSDINDADTFNEYYDKYLTNDFTEELSNAQDKKLRKEVFEIITSEHKSVIAERALGKIGRPREKFPKVEGKMKIDGDREAEIVISKKEKPRFIHLRYVKNKIVYAREDKITYTIKKGKVEYTRIVYRDRLGRFTSSQSLRTRKGVKLQQVI